MTHDEARELVRALPHLRQTARDDGKTALVRAFSRLERAIVARHWEGSLDHFQKFPVDVQLALEDVHELGGKGEQLGPFFSIRGGPWPDNS